MIFCKKNIVLLLAVGFAFTASNAIAANSVQKVKKVKQNFINGIALYEPAVQSSTEYAFQINGQPEQEIAKQPGVGTVKSVYSLAIGRFSLVNAITVYNASDILPKNSIAAECWNYDLVTALTEASGVSNSSYGSAMALMEASNISNSSHDSAMALTETTNVSNSSHNSAMTLTKVSNVSNLSYDSVIALTKASNVSNSSHKAEVAYQYATQSSVSNSSHSAEIAYQQATQSSIAAYRNSGVFSLDNVAYKMAFDQKNSLIQPAAETQPCIGSGPDTAVFSLDLAKPQICFYSLADRCISYANAFEYAFPDYVFGGCSILPVDGVKDSTVGLANRVSGVAYGDVFNAGISYLNSISKLDNKCQQPTIDKKAVLRSFYGISELDMIGMTRNTDSSWLSIPAQCQFRALQKIQNGEDPSEEFMAAALWQQREEDQALALETNKYVVSMSAIINMKSVSAKSIVVVGFYNALDQIKVIVAATQLNGKQLEIDKDLASLAIERLKQKNLMTNTVKARVYSHVMQTTFTFEVVKQP